MKFFYFIVLMLLTPSCNSQKNKPHFIDLVQSKKVKPTAQIAQYVVNIFEDSKGNLWFGTLEKGVAKYDGKALTYITQDDGLPSNRVVAIIEDKNGHLWFGTGSGLSKYDGNTFTNYSKKDGLCSNMISNLLIDSKGDFWIGSWEGICKMEGTSFNHFPLPYPKVNIQINPDTKDWITALKEDAGLNEADVYEIYKDKSDNIWISAIKNGVCKYDGSI